MTPTELLEVIDRAYQDQVEELDLSGLNLTELPPEIGKLTQLKTLILGKRDEEGYECVGNQLTTLPAEIANLTDLQTLLIADNQLKSLPQVLSKLKNLRELDLSVNALQSLSKNIIGTLIALTTLDLSANQLTTVPEAIGTLSNLMTLDLSNNQLTTVPEAIGSLSALTTLVLRSNQLTMLPKTIGNLTALTWLDLSYNQLTMLPEMIGNLSVLTWLDIHSNRLTTLPEAIDRLTALTSLDLEGNKLTTLPNEIGHLNALTELNLENNQLTMLPEKIGNFNVLNLLLLANNRLTALPETIGNLTALTTLDLHSNQLSTIPEEIGNLSVLTTLYLSNNRLTTLPETISNLSLLTTLHLSSNRLTNLPEAIGNLSVLTKLDLFYNPLKTLPQSLQNLIHLQKLDLRGTQLPIPPEVLGTNWDNLGKPADILAHYFSRQTRPLNEVKVLLVGQGTVGKTSLAERLIHNRPHPNPRKTDGIHIQPWSLPINQHTVQINLWDFGGQEIMHATHQFFLTQRSLYLLVINNRQTEAENRIEYWLNLIQSLGGDSPVILVGNHSDAHALDLDQPGLQAKYPQLKAFIATACPTGVGISELKAAITQQLSTLPHLHDLLPLPWFTLKQQLEHLHRNLQRDYIPYHEYEQMCIAADITQDQHQQTLIRFLHDLGVVLNFKHDRLQDTNVLNPEWVTNGIYKILNHNALITEHRGMLARSLIGNILDPAAYPPSKHLFIMDMMQQFELCFALEPDQHWLIPDLLPKNAPDTGDWSNALALQYHYNILPQSIISRFIVRMSAYISHHTYWRTGVVLASADGNRALVKADLYDQKIFIWVDGNPPTRRAFITAIRTTLGQIHSSLSRLQAQAKVPLPDHSHIVVDYQHLLTLERKNVREFIPEGLDEAVAVRPLLEGMERLGEGREERWEERDLKRDRKPKPQPEPPMPPEIFISYAWGGESEAFVNKLDTTLQAQGITIIRDKRDLGFKGLIKEFMQRIGCGNCVIAVISDKYLKSPNCMFELAEVAANGEFYDRIFPIVLSDAKIYKSVARLVYIKHWDQEIQELNEAMQGVSQDNLQGIREDMDLYRRIRTTIAQLTDTLKNMNTLTPDLHSDSEFAALIAAIAQRLQV